MSKLTKSKIAEIAKNVRDGHYDAVAFFKTGDYTPHTPGTTFESDEDYLGSVHYSSVCDMSLKSVQEKIQEIVS